MFLLLLAAFVLVLILSYALSKKQRLDIRSPDVPTVEGGLPIFGHSRELYEDTLGFMANCHKIHGDIFRIKVNSAEYVVVLNQKMIREITRKNEDEFSLYNVLNDELYITSAICNQVNRTEFYEGLNKGVHLNTSNSLPILKDESERLVNKLKHEVQKTELNFKGKNKDVPLTFAQQEYHLWRFAARASAASLFHMELSEKAFQAFSTFFSLLHYTLILSSFLPNSIIDFFFGNVFRFLRSRILPHFVSTIDKYQVNRSDGDATPMRTFAACCNATDGISFRTRVGDVMIGSLFASTKNSARCIQNILVDLAQNPPLAKELRSQLQEFVEQGNIEGILDSQLLHATLMETSRLYTTVFGIVRKLTKDTVLGGLRLNKDEIVLTCPPYLMRDRTIFQKPLVYNPHRFLGHRKESWSQDKIITWGAGTHLCPGKPFAIQTIKIGVAYILTHFDLELSSNDFNVQYSTTSAFADRKTDIKFTPLE